MFDVVGCEGTSIEDETLEGVDDIVGLCNQHFHEGSLFICAAEEFSGDGLDGGACWVRFNGETIANHATIEEEVANFFKDVVGIVVDVCDDQFTKFASQTEDCVG